jgi:putative membrane protein
MMSMFGLGNFGFSELWSPVFLLCAIAIAILYFYLTGPLRVRFKDSEPVNWELRVRFLSGLFLYYFALGGPLNILAHTMFSAHMLAMAIAYLIVPPLILLGLPAWLVRPLFEYKGMKIVLKAMHPLICLLLFNVLFSFYHIPVIHDVVMTNYLLHTIFYIVMLIAAFMMWWQITCPVPELRRLSDLQRMAYVFANGVLLTPACALIVFAGAPMYASFSDPLIWAKAMGYCIPAGATAILADFGGPDYFALIPALDDQQLGGVIMKLVQEIMYGGILAYIFFQWYRRENPDDEESVHPNEAESVELPGNPDLNRA